MSADLWARVRAVTPARVGLGRVGGSLPTAPLLEFELAHARARDAVHEEMDREGLARELGEAGFGEPLVVHSQARDRMEYLLRPDLGRRLDDASRERMLTAGGGGCELAVVIADGLSAVAPQKHAKGVLQALWGSDSAGASGAEAPQWLGLSARLKSCPDTQQLESSGVRMDSRKTRGNVTVVLAEQARVALGDEIGELLGARAVVVLIGERPGLSSPDSLGIYLTWAPRVGRTDAERNCISNVRPEGLSYVEAARKLAYLLGEAGRLGLSGVGLKDDSGLLKSG